MVVELGGEEGSQQLIGDDGGQAPDGVGRAKVNGHAVARLALKKVDNFYTYTETGTYVDTLGTGTVNPKNIC